jgi:hypothetical protein
MNAAKVEALRGAADQLRLTAAELAEELGLPRTPIMSFGGTHTAPDFLLKLARGGPEEYPLVRFLSEQMPEPNVDAGNTRSPHRKGRRSKVEG